MPELLPPGTAEAADALREHALRERSERQNRGRFTAACQPQIDRHGSARLASAAVSAAGIQYAAAAFAAAAAHALRQHAGGLIADGRNRIEDVERDVAAGAASAAVSGAAAAAVAVTAVAADAARALHPNAGLVRCVGENREIGLDRYGRVATVPAVASAGRAARARIGVTAAAAVPAVCGNVDARARNADASEIFDRKTSRRYRKIEYRTQTRAPVAAAVGTRRARAAAAIAAAASAAVIRSRLIVDDWRDQRHARGTRNAPAAQSVRRHCAWI